MSTMIRVAVSMNREYDFDRMISEAASALYASGHMNYVHWDSHEVDIDGESSTPVINCRDHSVDFYLE